MAITLSRYIYPIEHPIQLSKHHKYVIDNPRTEQEIEIVKRVIEPALIKHWENSAPGYNPMFSTVHAISQWREYCKARDTYVYNYFSENKDKSVDDILAESWLIVRYDDNGEFDKAAVDKIIFFSIFYSDKKHLYLDTYNDLLSYAHILSIFINDDEQNYIGASFILLPNPQDIFYPKYDFYPIIDALEEFKGNCSIANESRASSWLFFPDIKDKLIAACNTLDNSFKHNDEKRHKNEKTIQEKLGYIGDILRIVEVETHNVNVKLLLLVSIIEFLVTRNPDANRFNVEDSISKQFVLKASLLIYLNNKENDLHTLKKQLKLIYDQRSKVAHGSNIEKKDREEIVNSFFSLYSYIKALIWEYVKDPRLIDFIKQN